MTSKAKLHTLGSQEFPGTQQISKLPQKEAWPPPWWEAVGEPAHSETCPLGPHLLTALYSDLDDGPEAAEVLQQCHPAGRGHHIHLTG